MKNKPPIEIFITFILIFLSCNPLLSQNHNMSFEVKRKNSFGTERVYIQKNKKNKWIIESNSIPLLMIRKRTLGIAEFEITEEITKLVDALYNDKNIKSIKNYYISTNDRANMYFNGSFLIPGSSARKLGSNIIKKISSLPKKCLKCIEFNLKNNNVFIIDKNKKRNKVSIKKYCNNSYNENICFNYKKTYFINY